MNNNNNINNNETNVSRRIGGIINNTNEKNNIHHTDVSVVSEQDAPIEVKSKKELDFIWKIATGIFGFSTVGLMVALVIKGVIITWIVATFTFFILFIMMFGFLIYLGKKTHAILEFKAMITGKPISLFFTDHKRLDWKVIEPEGNILIDKSYGAFIVNEKGAYIDKKTKNIFLAFNPSIASSASIESFKITNTLNKVLKDEKQLSSIRHALMEGSVDGNDIIFQHNGKDERLSGFELLKENIDFSHLKSLLNTLIPHAINSKIEMTVQQRIGGVGKVNYAQIILMTVGIIAAATFAIMLLNMYGPSGATSTVTNTIIKEVATNASNVIGG